jgi:RNA polymerase sigma-70 factor (ECF subfamily)
MTEMTNRTIDEQKLIADCKRGNAKAQRKLYDLYAPVMMGVGMRYVKDYDDACDVLQDGFVKLFTKIGSYSGIGSFEGWARRIFVTTALEFLRERNALKFALNIDDLNDSTGSFNDTIVEKMSADELMKIIVELPDGYRAVFNLFAIEGFSHAEIAKVLEISEGTSRSQFARARKLLQKRLQEIY